MGEPAKEWKGKEHEHQHEEWKKYKGMGHMGGPGMGWMQMMRHRRGAGPMGPSAQYGGEMMPWMMEGPHAGKGPLERTDDQIKTKIEELLTKDSWLDASDVSVAVDSGVVTLTGKVDSRDSKRRAEDLTDRVMGVKDVTNSLEIISPEEEM